MIDLIDVYPHLGTFDFAQQGIHKGAFSEQLPIQQVTPCKEPQRSAGRLPSHVAVEWDCPYLQATLSSEEGASP